jgi:hypothetical protein
MLYQGQCHCGAVKFSFEHAPITEGLRCNCSICVRKGALMSNFFLSPDALTIDAAAGQIGLYQFASKVAKHHFCKTCGIYTFHETKRKPGHYRVNLGCIDVLDTLNMPVVIADGAAF